MITRCYCWWTSKTAATGKPPRSRVLPKTRFARGYTARVWHSRKSSRPRDGGADVLVIAIACAARLFEDSHGFPILGLAAIISGLALRGTGETEGGLAEGIAHMQIRVFID